MLMTKKAKIRKYLEDVGKDSRSAFDRLLSDYLDGKLSEKLQQIGIDKLDIHVDFLDDYKFIGIQGKYKQNFVDIQIEKTEFSIGCDPIEPIEPDEHDYHPLENEELFYATITQKLSE